MKVTLRRTRLEAVLLAVLREQPGCEGAAAVVVEGLEGDPNWGVEKVDSGSSGHRECVTALHYIVPDLQRIYALTDP